VIDTILIADLHLSAERLGTVELFLRFLKDKASRSQRLYILGDLFDVWLGDDDKTPPIPDILKGLSEVSSGGCQLFFIRGNRDFLIGDGFSRETGCALLQDTAVINISGESTLLMHGDQLVTNDIEYQKERALLRNDNFRDNFLSKPLSERKEIASNLRQKSSETKDGLPQSIMDVVEATVEEQMRKYNCWQLVHGHTHIQGEHDLRMDGRPGKRYVLGEWTKNQGPYLVDYGDGLVYEVFR
jgi:UDP-2,3-diacylglucosamine hydrolase